MRSRRADRWISLVLMRTVAGRVALASLALAAGVGAQQSPAPFAGQALVIASDGDMLAQAYAGDPLGPPARDALSILTFDGAARPRTITVPVPNSVIGPPASVAVTPDGRQAIVIETRGPRPARPAARLTDLPPGRVITVVDLDRASVIQRIAGRANPLSVSISPDGRLVAIAYDTAKAGGAPLDLLDLAGGRLSGRRSPAVPGWRAGEAVKNAAFAPNGALALVYATHPRLSLLRLTGGTLTRWGNDVSLGATPFEVRFTPDGRFALVNDMSAGPRGTVTAIALADPHDATPLHRITGKARTGALPEGLAVSPDGRWVATTNLERTAFAARDPRQGRFASVTLLRLDEAGRLTAISDTRFAGVIPESAAFDRSGRFLAVAVFDHLPPARSGGSLDLWRVADGGRRALVPTGVSLPLPRGAHSMAVAR